MTMHRRAGAAIRILALALTLSPIAACHPRGRAPQAPAVPEPAVDLRQGMERFRRGDSRRAQLLLQRASFGLPPGSAELAQARYYIAESWFQLGDYIQAAS